jgi:hypothetical protein
MEQEFWVRLEAVEALLKDTEDDAESERLNAVRNDLLCRLNDPRD